jgi:hypothetical protein
MCLFMLYSSLEYARGLSIIGLLPLALGVPLYFASQKAKSNSSQGMGK